MDADEFTTQNCKRYTNVYPSNIFYSPTKDLTLTHPNIFAIAVKPVPSPTCCFLSALFP